MYPRDRTRIIAQLSFEMASAAIMWVIRRSDGADTAVGQKGAAPERATTVRCDDEIAVGTHVWSSCHEITTG